jgi:hypothetical protein
MQETLALATHFPQDPLKTPQKTREGRVFEPARRLFADPQTICDGHQRRALQSARRTRLRAAPPRSPQLSPKLMRPRVETRKRA